MTISNLVVGCIYLIFGLFFFTSMLDNITLYNYKVRDMKIKHYIIILIFLPIFISLSLIFGLFKLVEIMIEKIIE